MWSQKEFCGAAQPEPETGRPGIAAATAIGRCVSHSATFSMYRIKRSCKEELSWRLEDGESEQGYRTCYAQVGTCEVLEAGRAGPQLRLMGSIDCRKCSR